MMWFFAVLVVLLLGGIAAVASGWGRPLGEVHEDRPDTALGGGTLAGDAAGRRLRGADLRGVRFPLALRGYRMAEVDALLDRLADQLDADQPPGDRGTPREDPRAAPAEEPGEADR